MSALFLAYLVALVHGLVVLVMIGGPLFFLGSAQRWRWLEGVYVVTSLLVVGSYLWLGDCFLSIWENELRARVDPTLVLNEGFIRSYLGLIGLDWHNAWNLPVAVFFLVIGYGRLIGFWLKERTS